MGGRIAVQNATIGKTHQTSNNNHWHLLRVVLPANSLHVRHISSLAILCWVCLTLPAHGITAQHMHVIAHVIANAIARAMATPQQLHCACQLTPRGGSVR